MVAVYCVYVAFMAQNQRISAAVEAALVRRREARGAARRAAARDKFPYSVIPSGQPAAMSDSAMVRCTAAGAVGSPAK